MKLTLPLTTKKALSALVVLLLIGNFVSIMSSLSYTSEENLNPIKNSQKDFNPYIGENCTKLGEYDSIYGQPLEMIISDLGSKTYAFIREMYGILVVDISFPEEPIFVTHLFERESLISFCVSGEYLYIVDYALALFIYSIQDIYNPLLVFYDEFMEHYYFTKLFVFDDILYVCDGAYGLVTLNVSNPLNPQFISRYQHPLFYDYFYSVVVRDNFVFITGDNTLQILDMTDIYNPNLTGIFVEVKASYSELRDLVLQDDLAYIVGGDGSFFILNISDVSNPTLVNHIWDQSLDYEGFHLIGSTGYLLTSNEGLVLLDLTNMHQIKYLQKVYNPGSYRSLGYHNGYIILLDSFEGLEIYNIKEDYSVEFVARFWDGGWGTAIKVWKNHAFVANSYNGLEIYKISNSFTPELRSRLYLGTQCGKFFFNKDLVYIITINKDLFTIDVSNKRNPKVLGSQSLLMTVDNLTHWPNLIEMYGNQAFIYYFGPSQRFLAILDITNSTGYQITDILPLSTSLRCIVYDSPYLYLVEGSRNFTIYHYDENQWELIASVELDSSIRDLFVHQNYAYFAMYDDLRIYNVTNPQNPVETVIFHGFENPYEGYDKVVVNSDTAYLIGESNNELQFLNVQDKNDPFIEGSFQCNDSLEDVFVKDNVVYLTGRYINIEIIQHDKFVSLLNYIIYTPIAVIGFAFAIPIIVLVFIRIRRRRTPRKTTPTTISLPREEISIPTQDHDNTSGISVSPEEYDDPKLLALAKKIVEAAEKDSI